jgi:hypothetical protein
VGNTLSVLGGATEGVTQGLGQTVGGATKGPGNAAKGLGQSVNKTVGAYPEAQRTGVGEGKKAGDQ